VRLLNDEGSRLTPAGAPAAWLVDAGFRIVDALHVGSGLSQGNLLLMERDSQNRPVLPGSAIKGVLRSRCEFILRSLDVPACLDGSCGECPTCQLFGYSLPKPDSYGRTGRRGILVFHDSLVEVETETQRAHVAIDRVTGGSRDSALYSTECIDQGSLRIRVEALETPPPWTVGLLAAALRDVSDGYVGFGGATTRGYGSLRRTDASEVAESQMFSDLQEIRDSFSKAGS
jgi:CRISPR/Cas system CSM-associated protein Csm3 (group 7 of RAMP superfamily)